MDRFWLGLWVIMALFEFSLATLPSRSQVANLGNIADMLLGNVYTELPILSGNMEFTTNKLTQRLTIPNYVPLPLFKIYIIKISKEQIR